MCFYYFKNLVRLYSSRIRGMDIDFTGKFRQVWVSMKHPIPLSFLK